MLLGPDLSQAPGAGNWKKLAKSLELMVGTGRNRPRWQLNNVVQQLPGQLLAGCWATPPQGAVAQEIYYQNKQTRTRGPLLGGLTQARGSSENE